jgi:hypothetical protein
MKRQKRFDPIDNFHLLDTNVATRRNNLFSSISYIADAGAAFMILFSVLSFFSVLCAGARPKQVLYGVRPIK